MTTTPDIRKLEAKIDDANQLYHTFGDSGISDAEYDSWLVRLEQLDPTNKRIKKKKVGAKVAHQQDKWTKFKHDTFKMGSQNKVTTLDALTKWANKLPNEKWVVEHKLDGTSIKIIYENGKLVTAATRGDGDTGEEITINVKKMKGIPATIKETRTVVFRGEILLYKSDLAAVGGKNTRNSAAGTAKRLDGVGCEHLNVQIYSVMNWEVLGLKTVVEVVKFIKSNGLVPVNMDGPFTTLQEVEDYKDAYEKKTRKTLNWDIDGLIVQTNTLEHDAWDYPERSMAYKFQAEEAVTKLIAVEWNDTGGRIAPKGILEPVDIMGTTVSAATLNNVEHIKRLGVKIGDLVVVSRRNDVIPCIERVSIAATNGKSITPPTHDADGFPIVHEKNANGEELVYLVSTNPNSRAKVIRSILSWYTAHNAKGLAGETVAAVLECGAATDLPTFYEVSMNGSDKLVGIDGFGAGKFKIMRQATLLTSKTTLINFLNGMDFQGFGESRFLAILEHYKKPMGLDEFLHVASDIAAVSTIPGFGENTAKSLAKEIKDARPLINKMRDIVSIDDWAPVKLASTKINGLSFCFTGAMTYQREELEAAVKKHGGVVAGVSKKLDYLVTNDPNSGTGKNEKADKLGIKKIHENEFLKMIGGNV